MPWVRSMRGTHRRFFHLLSIPLLQLQDQELRWLVLYLQTNQQQEMPDLEESDSASDSSSEEEEDYNVRNFC